MLNNMLKSFGKMCGPAQLYVSLSVLTILYMMFENMDCFSQNMFRMGGYKCHLGFPTMILFIGKVLYIAVWTIILDSLCRSGYKTLSWIFVLLPIVLFVLAMILLIILMNMEANKNNDEQNKQPQMINKVEGFSF